MVKRDSGRSLPLPWKVKVSVIPSKQSRVAKHVGGFFGGGGSRQPKGVERLHVTTSLRNLMVMIDKWSSVV